MKSKIEKISGVSLPSAQFKVHETTQSMDVDAVVAVLEGNLAAYRIRNYLSLSSCQKIVENFWLSPNKVARYGYGEDGVEGYFLGASHIEKSTNEYLHEAHAFSHAIDDLYKGTDNPLTIFRNKLIENNKYKCIRPAMAAQLSAGHSKAVYWNDTGDFLLKPHEDFSQLSDPRQNGFEIQLAKRVMAVNFYADVPKNSGQLKLWNIEPDNKTRETLNLSHSGYPYPAELLADFPSIIIPVETADLCVINGNLAHAVLRGEPSALPKNRLLITCFMTFNDDNEIIWWT